jgi:hypothetical protein
VLKFTWLPLLTFLVVAPESASTTGSGDPGSGAAGGRSGQSRGGVLGTTKRQWSATGDGKAARPSLPADRGLADLDPDNDFEVAPPAVVADCDAQLQAAGVEFSAHSFPLKQPRGNTFTCGSEQAVLYRRGPEKFRFNARPQVTCRVALGLARFERIAQEEAERHLGVKIVRVSQLGTYNCRKMARFTNMVSEHSYGNAIDIAGVELSNGRKLTVLKHFGPLQTEPQTKEAKFWRALAQRLYREDVFSVVLTPFFDSLHKDHFHLDQARYRLDGTGS